MFDMKYDKDGRPVPQKETLDKLQEDPNTPIANDVAQEEVVQRVAQEETTDDAGINENEMQIDSEKNTIKDDNFKRLREKTSRLEQERNEAIQYAKDLEKRWNAKQEPAKEVVPEQDLHLNPDDLVEGKHLSKYDKRMLMLEKKLQSYEQVSSESRIEAKLNNNFPDFASVVSNENVNALRDMDPDLALAISHTPDLYKKAALAYKTIKRLGIGQKDAFVKDREIAKQNSLKPKTLHAVSPQRGSSPMSHANAFANGLTPELRDQLRREMNAARKNS